MVPFVGGSYTLDVRKADVQRTVNMFPVEAENAGSSEGTYLQSIPGLDVFSEAVTPPPSSTLWLDLFDGAANTPLNDHPQDIPLNGSTWSFNGEFNMPRLSGTGSAGDFTGFSSGQLGASTSISPATLQSGWTFEMDVTPLQSVTTDPGSQAFTRFDVGPLTVLFEPSVPSDPFVGQIEFFVGDSTATFPLPAGPAMSVKVLVETDGWTATIDGVAQAKVPATGFDMVMGDISTQLGVETSGDIRPIASMQRLELKGVLV